VGVFGLANVVMPAGGDFVEVLEPTRADASGARYLGRRGGDAGYMVILQSEDALAHRARLEALGVRVIARSDRPAYAFTHFHPGDCAGVLLSIDSVGGGDPAEPMSDWPPAGPDWREHPSSLALGLASVTIQARDPRAAARRWAELLDRTVDDDDDDAEPEIRLDHGAIRFVPPRDEDGTGVVGLEIRVRDPAAVLTRAAAARITLHDGAAMIGGVAVRPC
jgi:hypothetical protein